MGIWINTATLADAHITHHTLPPRWLKRYILRVCFIPSLPHRSAPHLSGAEAIMEARTLSSSTQ